MKQVPVGARRPWAAAAVPERDRRGGDKAKGGGGHHGHVATQRHQRSGGAKVKRARARA